ncbi:MAG: polysaccharide biosynthesis tyrosine autokinase [Gemmatimonadaceae bacterium]
MPRLGRSSGGRPRDEIDFHALWTALRRNQLIIVGCLVVAVAAAVLISFLTTPTYEAVALIQLDQTPSSDRDFLTERRSTGEVNTDMELIHSRTFAESVADSLGLQVLIEEPRRVARSDILAYVGPSHQEEKAAYELTRESGGRFAVKDQATDRRLGVFAPGERIRLGGITVALSPTAVRYDRIRLRVRNFDGTVQSLRSALSVARPRDPYLVEVRYQSSDPLLARDVPNAIAARFIAHRQSVQQSQARSMVSFLRLQIDTLSRQLASSENVLRTFREGRRVISPDVEASSQTKRLTDLQADRNVVEAERQALAKLLVNVRAAAATRQPGQSSPYRRLLAFPTLLRNQAASGFLSTLMTLENERATLLARRRPEDPDMQALTSRVSEIEEQLQSVAETYLEGLASQVASMDATLGEFGQELGRIPANEMQYTRLQRQPKLLQEMYTLLQTRLKEAEITQAVDDPGARIIDVATTPDEPIKPRKGLNVALGALVGLMLGAATTFARAQLDRTIRTRDDVQLATGSPLLALIPHMPGSPELSGNGQQRALAAPLKGQQLLPYDPVAESYRTLRTNMLFTGASSDARTLVFTSPMPGDGKTTVSANTAVVLTQQGKRVILIDADMRRGRLNRLFSRPRAPGLSDVLNYATSLEEVRQRIELASGQGLDLVTTGTLPPNAAELLGSMRMHALLERLEREYDIIIFDTPPLNVVTDAAVLSSSADGVVLVVRAGVTVSDALGYAMEQLRSVSAPILGVVINDIDFKKDRSYYPGWYGREYEAQEQG